MEGKNELIKSNQELSVTNEKITEDIPVLYGTVETLGKLDIKGVINELLQVVNIADVLSKIDAKKEYIVQIPPQFRKAFEEGTLKIMESDKTGKMWPTLVEKAKNGKNTIVTNLPVKEELLVQGNPIESLANGYQNLFLQQQLRKISAQLEATYNTVREIEEIQKDDRMGMLISARNRILLALEQSKEDREKHLPIAIHDLSIVQGQVYQTFNRKAAEFKTIPKQEWLNIAINVFKKNYFDDIGKSYRQMVNLYDAFLSSTNLQAYAYCLLCDNISAKNLYQQAIDMLKAVDYSKIKTFKYIENNPEPIYDIENCKLLEDKVILLSNTDIDKNLLIEITGEELLEVIEDNEQ